MGQIPFINNLVKPLYNGFVVKPGETPEHLAKRPVLTKINNKKALYICIGASTPGQISTVLEQLGATLKDVKILNCCTGAADINDWLDPNSAAWSNLEDDLVKAGYDFTEVQGILMCHDDLKDQSTAFPAASQKLADLMEQFIIYCKSISVFPNLKVVDLFSRLYGGWITDPKFGGTSDYNNSFSIKFLTEKAIANGGTIAGVYVSDGFGHLYTDGEVVRFDGFFVKKSEMKQRGTSVHIDTRTELDNRCANQLFNGLKVRGVK